jgi:hypothetical protein
MSGRRAYRKLFGRLAGATLVSRKDLLAQRTQRIELLVSRNPLGHKRLFVALPVVGQSVQDSRCLGFSGAQAGNFLRVLVNRHW